MTNSIGIEFVWISPGTFMMGSNNGKENERPVHQVTIREGFYLGRYEVTQGQWQQVMGTTIGQQLDKVYPEREGKSWGEGEQHPMHCVNWNEAQEFIRQLNSLNDGYTYQLPSEAEWEYACRAGTTADYAGELDAVGWYVRNSNNTTHPVGSKQPNAFGLYDMHGNVWEWCEDWKHENYNGAPTDGSSWLSGGDSEFRVMRGGSRFNPAIILRSANRNSANPDWRANINGFRVVAVARA